MKQLISITLILSALCSCNQPMTTKNSQDNSQPTTTVHVDSLQDTIPHSIPTEKSSQLQFDFSDPKDISTLKSLTLYATQYYIYKAKDGGTIPLLDKNEKPIGFSLDTCDWCLAAIEGTLYIKDKSGKNVVLNYVGKSKELQVNCNLCPKLKDYANKSIGKSLWAISNGYGDGVSGYKLIPFRTIAVDKSKIPYGTVIFIPSARGKSIRLPDGKTTLHDGYFFAGDKGGDINNNHIDVFTGIETANPFPEVIKSNSQKTFNACIITDTSITKQLQTIHKSIK